jgi:hypothetical protein
MPAMPQLSKSTETDIWANVDVMGHIADSDSNRSWADPVLNRSWVNSASNAVFRCLPQISGFLHTIPKFGVNTFLLRPTLLQLPLRRFSQSMQLL